MAAHDLIIRGGTVLDGTGGPARTADVAVSDGVVTEVGRVDGRATQELDADGLLVTPGLVDIHVHYDGQATWDDRLIPSAWHGVTTVVAGNCGVGFAPVRPADHDRLIQLMEGVEDIPGAALHEGLPWTWQSFPEFLDALDGRRYDVDIATHVPHGALRLNVMGERGAQRETATPEDIEAMAALAREAVEAGAIGFSTSRTRNHRSSNGELTPTLTADADELLGIARAVGATGTGVLQVVSDFDDVDAEFGLFRSMAEASGRPLSFSLAGVDPQKYPRQLALLDEANAAGVRMRGQAAARAIGILVGLQCTVNPLAGNPLWQELADLPVAEQARAMADPSFKERFLAAGDRPLGGADRMFELGDPPDYEPDPSTSIAARATRDGRSALDLAYDLFLQDEGRTFLYVPIINWFDGSLDGVGEMLAHQHTVPGLSDGGAHVGTICDASFPTTFLSLWGRDRERGRLDLAYLVRQHTKDTAETVGLLDRGVLAPGYRADVNLIDFDALRPRRPEMRHDLPAGGKRLLQRADGYHATLVKGAVTYRNGEPTDALPGRLLRGATAAPAR
jgi:N-acyl-D-aspartate/D-glutamate deacylase